MHHISTKQAFEPEDLTYLKALCDDITGQAWFYKSDDAKQAFALYLIETFPAGEFDQKTHRAVVEASAHMFYSAVHPTAA